MNPKHKLHARRGKITTFFLTQLKTLTALFRTPDRSVKSQGKQQCHAFRENASLPPGHRLRKLQCQVWTERTCVERRVTLSDKKGKAKKNVQSQRCILHKGRHHSHEDNVAVRRIHSRHQYFLAHICADK